MALVRVTATFRASGIPNETTTGNVYDLADGKTQMIRIFIDREKALEAARAVEVSDVGGERGTALSVDRRHQPA